MSVLVGFIGAGNIVKAILTGIDKGGKFTHDKIAIFDRKENAREKFKSDGYIVYDSIDKLVKNSPIIVVAVTPQAIRSIVPDIKAGITEKTVLLSVVAGISTQWYKENIDEKSKVIRCMPTLTAQEGMGSFAVCKSEDITDEEFKDVENFLSSCGIVEKIPEDLMDEVVPLNGSAPGYFYHMANVIANEGEKMGFDKEVALRLFAQTMKGSAETILNSGMSIETLESKLRLKGGTTIAALDKMDELGFERCIIEGVRACVARSKELGKL